VTNYFGNTVTKLRATTGATVGTMRVGDSPTSIIIDANVVVVRTTPATA
jgi:DNA-binding beta-propeller fold protein YncE